MSKKKDRPQVVNNIQELNKEIETEKGPNYIISVFSGIVSFSALIVALVALFKGVG